MPVWKLVLIVKTWLKFASAGQSRRFQPKKPSTKAQAAVALTSGRMTEAIHNELLRLKAESSARKVEVEAIRSELLDRGDIKRFWDKKLKEERTRGFEVEKAYHAAVSDLEQEKVVQGKHFADNLKEKVAMDCQRQLLLSLKEEVNEMSEKLASERASYVAEQSNLQDLLSDLEFKQERMLDTKSVLKAEIEALRILRYDIILYMLLLHQMCCLERELRMCTQLA